MGLGQVPPGRRAEEARPRFVSTPLVALVLAALGWIQLHADKGTTPPAAPPAPAPFAEGRDKAASGSQPSGKEAAPVLLLEEGPVGAGNAENLADNSRCEVCHLNLVAEELALKHARAGVSCAKCHGECDAHIADESWASGGNGTAPEIMYPRDKIATGCMTCHNAEQVFQKAEKHKPEAWLIAYEVKTCTECHGKHRLPTRKCKWK
jgi:hypothetical protein